MKKILFAITACLIGIGATTGAASAQQFCGPEGADPATCLPDGSAIYPIPTTTVAQLPPPTTTTPPTTTQPPPQQQPLPATGSNVSNVLRGGALLVVGGLVAVGFARRRRPSNA